jgi:hypothetical protein
MFPECSLSVTNQDVWGEKALVLRLTELFTAADVEHVP